MGCASSSSTTANSAKSRLLDDYKIDVLLGEGAFGVVYACTHRQTGKELAVKMVDKVETPVETIRKEVKMLQCLDHPNIVKFHQVFHERCFVCIVMDKYSGGDLVDGLHLHFSQNGKLHDYEIVHISSQMAMSLQYLHRMCIAHRDVKGDNFLMDRKKIADPACRIVLSDFGTACTVLPDQRLSTEVGTQMFWAPEVYDKNYGLKVDVFAMGVVMYGLLDGRFPFKDEDDTRSKQPEFPFRMHPDCEGFIHGLLQKNEGDRLSAEAAAGHSWLSIAGFSACSSRSFEGVRLGEDMNLMWDIRQDGLNEGTHARRQELLQRLNDAHGPKRAVGDAPMSQAFFEPQFNLTDSRVPGLTLQFEWWGKKVIESAGILAFSGERKDFDRLEDSPGKSPEVVGQMLREHNIDVDAFGRGEAKTLEQLSREVQTGAVSLLLDATDYKKLVRVVDVVLLRFYDSARMGRLLFETAEKYPDGRGRSICRLPGTKKEPFESSLQTAQRVVSMLLPDPTMSVFFDIDNRDRVEEETISPSFPGVRTVYRKEIITCFVEDLVAAEQLPLESWGATDSRGFEKSFTWMTHSGAEACEVNLSFADKRETSGLVMAPIGYKEHELRQLLQAKGIDPSLYGKDGAISLKAFASELMKGESSLQHTGDSLVRVVDLVLLRVLAPSGDILVHTRSLFADKPSMEVMSLPCAKKRPDENQFLTAKRVLVKQLQIDENLVKMEPGSVRLFETEKYCTEFPGVRIVCRKRIVTVKVLRSLF